MHSCMDRKVSYDNTKTLRMLLFTQVSMIKNWYKNKILLEDAYKSTYKCGLGSHRLGQPPSRDFVARCTIGTEPFNLSQDT